MKIQLKQAINDPTKTGHHQCIQGLPTAKSCKPIVVDGSSMTVEGFAGR